MGIRCSGRERTPTQEEVAERGGIALPDLHDQRKPGHELFFTMQSVIYTSLMRRVQIIPATAPMGTRYCTGIENRFNTRKEREAKTRANKSSLP